jgi:uncharacterized protein
MKKVITMLFLCFIGACISANAQETVSMQDVQAELAKAKSYTIVFFIKGTREENKDEAVMHDLHMKHLQYLFTLKKKNVISVFGPLTDNSDIRGILIFNSTDQAEVKKYLDQDSFIKEGYMAYEIHPWFGIPGQSLDDKK